MPSKWLLVPAAADAPDGRQPKYSGEDGIEGWTGQVFNEGRRELFLARFTGTQTALDSIANQRDVTALPRQGAVNRLNRRFGRNHSLEEWEQRFWTAGPSIRILEDSDQII